ncbi:uncharacterized protein LAJ45_09200 [Morchella importuna]|uniref:uncharacterized protein n=1 Tax=Morchella importuna TaxID=1174673 RepID=UPI001E8CA4AE|nr:uncharacterized protein LAJ45_09200 [Morchella importuna]KAH8146826.1 hypothetical protein LAJ45_09200 [Morchella importuna]
MEDISSMHGLDMNRGPLSPPPTARPRPGTGNGSITPPEAPLKRSLSLPRTRLSLSFPVLPAGSNFSPRGAPPSPVYSPKHQHHDVDKPVTPDDPMAFLTALAAQERRVLELKEELGKAETELGRLKRQWAVHEATMKLHEITPTERLRPLNTSIAAAEVGVHSPGREQYQAKVSSVTGRKVSSQRHTRTLSLLAGSRDDTPPALVKRHTVAHSASSSHSDADREKRNSQDALLRTGKQMAEDFKEGLWTFIEDLRQATVGDEAISSTVNSTGIRASPHGTRSTSPRVSIRSGSPASSLKRERRREESLIDFGDDDSKSTTNRIDEEENLLLDHPSSASSSSNVRWSTSTANSDTLVSSSSRSSTPRTSTSSTTSNAIWNQAVVATTLKKATALVEKVEKSLAPLPATGAGSTGYYEGKQGELRARPKTVGKKNA